MRKKSIENRKKDRNKKFTGENEIAKLFKKSPPEDIFPFASREMNGERDRNIDWLPSHTHHDRGSNLQPGYVL